MHESIIKWEIYCNTEQKYVSGFLEKSEGPPTTCFNNNEHTINTSKTKYLETIYRDTTELIKWKVFCDTEQIWTYGYHDHLDPPEHCFNNNTHTVSKLPIFIEKIYNNTPRIKEENIETGGNFCVENIVLDIPGVTGLYTQDKVFPFPINLLNTFYQTDDTHDGDTLDVEVGPDMVIATLTDGVSGGITSGITVSNLDYINLGYYLSVDDGVTSYSLGRCTGMDLDTNKINVEFQTDKSYSSGALIKRTVKFVNNFSLSKNENRVLGANKIGASYFPANTIGRIKYTNNNGQAKKFKFGLEYLY